MGKKEKKPIGIGGAIGRATVAGPALAGAINLLGRIIGTKGK